jgi:hypothetical protein
MLRIGFELPSLQVDLQRGCGKSKAYYLNLGEEIKFRERF